MAVVGGRGCRHRRAGRLAVGEPGEQANGSDGAPGAASVRAGAPRGEKTALIEAAIARQPGDFSVSDLQHECPGVGVDLIRQVLKRQKEAALLVCLGRGPAAKWRKAAK